MKFLLSLVVIFGLSSLNADSFKDYLKMKKVATSYYKSGDKQKAVDTVKDYLKFHEDSIRGKNLLAVFYYWNGDLKGSKKILHDILKKSNFVEAKSLLENIENKLAKNRKRFTPKHFVKKDEKQVIEKSITQKKQDNSTDGLLKLVSNIQQNPNDIRSRKELAKYYAKIGNRKKATYFAYDALKIDPDDVDMLALIKKIDQKNSLKNNKKVIKDAFAKLKIFFKSKEYDKFLNLYDSLNDNNIHMPTSFHVDALYCAISLKEYKKAKTILHIYRLPHNKHIQEIKKLVDEKLLLKRFASNELSGCESGACPIRR